MKIFGIDKNNAGASHDFFVGDDDDDEVVL